MVPDGTKPLPDLMLMNIQLKSLGTNFSEIRVKIPKNYWKQRSLKLSSAMGRHVFSGFDVSNCVLRDFQDRADSSFMPSQ